MSVPARLRALAVELHWAAGVLEQHLPPGLLSVDELDITVRAANALQRAGIRTVEQLQRLTSGDVLALPHMDAKGLASVRKALEARRAVPRRRVLPGGEAMTPLDRLKTALAASLRRSTVAVDPVDLAWALAHIESLEAAVQAAPKAAARAALRVVRGDDEGPGGAA